MTKIDRIGLAILVFGGAVVMSGVGGIHFGAPVTLDASESMKSKVDKASAGGPPAVNVAEIVDWNWWPDPAFAGTGAIVWDLEIRNTSSQDIRFVTANFVAYDANGKQVATDESWVISIPPGQSRSGKGYADLRGTEATATVEIKLFGFESKDMPPMEQAILDETLLSRKINPFCRVEQAWKDKLPMTAKSLKKRWPNDEDCRDGYKLQACFFSNAEKGEIGKSSFMESCKRLEMRPPQDSRTQEAACLMTYAQTPLWEDVMAGAKRCMPLITPAIAPAYRTWVRMQGPRQEAEAAAARRKQEAELPKARINEIAMSGVFALFSCLTNVPAAVACQMHDNPEYQNMSGERCQQVSAAFQRQYPNPNHQWRCGDYRTTQVAPPMHVLDTPYDRILRYESFR